MSAVELPSPWSKVLELYELGAIRDARPGSGTAAAKLVFTTERGRFIVRARRSFASLPEVVAYDHSVIRTVAQAGIPTATPLPSKSGKTWVEVDGIAYEVFPYLEGLLPYDQFSREQLCAAARTLARLHAATARATPEGSKKWPREHEARAMAETLQSELLHTGQGASSAVRTRAHRMLALLDELAATLQPAILAALPHAIIHGDYTPANVLFREGGVGAVFDFDWASWQPRVIDLGEGLIFFAGRRPSAIDPADIWSLVQSWQPDVPAFAAFLSAYQEVQRLTDAECELLPYFMLETWLGVRVRAMRKVEPHERLRILTEGALEPAEWLVEQRAAITELARQTHAATG